MENIQAKINKKWENKISSINIKDKTDDNKKVIKEYLNIESTEKKKKKKKKKEKKVQEDKIITQYDISKKCNEGSEKMDLIFDWNEWIKNKLYRFK
jgi:predicted O-linked N-acetylglucosamine transferase (SPINDLY family)